MAAIPRNARRRSMSMVLLFMTVPPLFRDGPLSSSIVFIASVRSLSVFVLRSFHLRFCELLRRLLGPPDPARAVAVLRPRRQIPRRLQVFPPEPGRGGNEVVEQRLERFPARGEAGPREG